MRKEMFVEEMDKTVRLWEYKYRDISRFVRGKRPGKFGMEINRELDAAEDGILSLRKKLNRVNRSGHHEWPLLTDKVRLANRNVEEIFHRISRKIFDFA